jgi:hypothetical protein
VPGFPQAIEEATRLLELVESKGISEAAAREQAVKLLDTVEEARGFFVALLTGRSCLADEPSGWLLDALKERSEMADELLVKNLAMSSATRLTHTRKNDMEAAAGSALVASRSAKLIKTLRSQSLKAVLEELVQAVEAKLEESNSHGRDDASTNRFIAFLSRWSYDREQLETIKRESLAVLS